MHTEGYFHPETEDYKYWTQSEEKNLKELVETGKYSFKEIGKKMNRSSQSCQSHSRLMGLNNKYINKKYSQDSNFWSTPNLLNCYWAGLSAADCYIAIRGKNKNNYTYVLSLASMDKDHVRLFAKTVKYSGIIEDQTRNKKRNIKDKIEFKDFFTTTVRIHDNKWGEDLAKNFNIITKKSKRLYPPNLDDDILKLSYYLGYTDGDGCLCLVNRQSINKIELVFRFTSASYYIIEWLKDLIDRLFPKEKYSLRNRKTNVSTSKNGKYHSFTIIGMRALVLYDYLKDFPVPKMERKWFRQELLDFLEKNKELYPEFFVKERLDFSEYL